MLDPEGTVTVPPMVGIKKYSEVEQIRGSIKGEPVKYLACRAVGVGVTTVRCGGGEEEEVEPCQVHMLMEDYSSEANNCSNRALFVDFCGFV